MAEKGRGSGMLTSTIILGVLAAVLLIIGYYRGEAQHILGVKAGFTMLVEILPMLLFAFIVAGMVNQQAFSLVAQPEIETAEDLRGKAVAMSGQ